MKQNTNAQIIHKLNNLLTSVGLSAQLLLRESSGVLNARQKKYVRTIISDGKKITTLLKKIT